MLYFLLIIAGFLAGVINTVAGGGSFLTLPALMLFGLDPSLANGTNRIAILFSTASSAATFHRHQLLDSRMTVRLAVPTLLGVPPGAWLAIVLPGNALEGAFGVLFLLMAGVLAWNPKRLLNQNSTNALSWPVSTIVFFLIGVYVGFIQAGMGILLLLAMSWVGTGSLVASNAIKNAIGFLVTSVAVAAFAISGQIQWLPGLVMASGNLLGGFVGARLAIRKGNRLIFGGLLIVMVLTGIKLLVSGMASGS